MSLGVLVLLGLFHFDAGGTELGPGQESAWNYVLLEGSQLVDDCPVCARPTIAAPLRGTFKLRLLQADPIGATYAVEDISFTGGPGVTPRYSVTGSGTFRIGGEVALVQQMVLETRIDNGSTLTAAKLDSSPGGVERLWPMISVSVLQTNGTAVQIYELHLAAAPLREIWFSTANGFHSGIWSPPTNAVSGGDVLSSSGRIIRRNQDLSARLGIMPPVPDLGLDAFEVEPGGEIAFSIPRDIFSETLGPLQNGDVLSDSGRVLRRNQDLLAAFGVQPPVPDVGLDALASVTKAEGTNEVWFSTATDIFSERLGKLLHRGDVLSSQGTVVRSNQQLLARFAPADPGVDYGLDALYVWPSGEIWFSTEQGFTSKSSETYLAGDLLSDQGYVVFRNLELLNPFAPIEDVNNFGLDALWIVTDSIPPAAPPRVTSIKADAFQETVALQWNGAGHVFQVEAADGITGPFLPLSPTMPDRTFDDTSAFSGSARAARFYRIRQW